MTAADPLRDEIRRETGRLMTAMDQWADLDTHQLEGIAVMGGRRFSGPLISHIIGNLWTGGCINGVRLPDDFRYVVSLYPWERYRLGLDTRRFEVELLDAAEVPDERLLRWAAEKVNKCLAKGQTLVHCQAGLNRSGLIAGLALVLGGMSPGKAIGLLRQKRDDAVLCNSTFEAWLRGQDGTP